MNDHRGRNNKQIHNSFFYRFIQLAVKNIVYLQRKWDFSKLTLCANRCNRVKPIRHAGRLSEFTERMDVIKASGYPQRSLTDRLWSVRRHVACNYWYYYFYSAPLNSSWHVIGTLVLKCVWVFTGVAYFYLAVNILKGKFFGSLEKTIVEWFVFR